jgi:serine/threonine-protein kinase
VSDRSDVFSLGVVAYELWLGIHPFLRDDSESTARAVQYEEPLSPTAIQPSLPIPLATLLMRMLAKKPGQRPSASLVASEVLAFLQMSWR